MNTDPTYINRMIKKFYGDLNYAKTHDELTAKIRQELREFYSIKGEFKRYG